jgi:hypothetical protein
MALTRSFFKVSFIFTLCILNSASIVFGQLWQSPLPKYELVKTTIHNLNSSAYRILESVDTLSLPFWDDFSRVIVDPDDALWLYGNDVTITQGIAINPPTINVASFDGVDALGRPYSSEELSFGLGDSLVSKPIFLNLPASQRDSVYFSFFWQMQGLGNRPNAEDFFRLEFLDRDQKWHVVWEQSGANVVITDRFFYQNIKVDPDLFFFDGFKFRFRSSNRLSGAFDNWNLDYIFLNQGRSGTNFTPHFPFPDRALTSRPTSIFTDYYAIPLSEFRKDPSNFINSSNVQFYNLDNDLQPIDYTWTLTDTISGQLLQNLNDLTVVNPVPRAYERRTFESGMVALWDIPEETDSLVIENKVYIRSGDNFLIKDIIEGDTIYFEQVDFRNNDTTISYLSLKDYFAYDDGEAEFSAGISQRGGRIAVQFQVSEPVLLSHIDIYFPGSGARLSGNPLTIFVWDRLVDDANIFKGRISSIVQTASGINQFSRYTFDIPIAVNDTFYIGFEQSFDERLPVGLDKNTDSGEKIFFNVRGIWEQNRDIRGSLMMRPAIFLGEITSAENSLEQRSPVLYPNPNQGLFNVKNPPSQWTIQDLSGRIILAESSCQNDEIQISLGQLKSGIYLFVYETEGKKSAQKFIVR